MNVYERINKYKGITQQRPSKLLVLYNRSGRKYLASCLVHMPKEFTVKANGSRVKMTGFIAESATYYYAPKTENEGHFLVAVLNSTVVFSYLKVIKAVRDIHKKIWELPIPEFDSTDPKHMKLVKLAKSCEAKSHSALLKEVKNIESVSNIQTGTAGMLRRKLRAAVSDDLKEIDTLVNEILEQANEERSLRKHV